VSSLITVCRTVTAIMRTVAIAIAVATATPIAIPTTTTTITAMSPPLLIPDIPPTPTLVTIAIPLTSVPVPPVTVEVATVRVVAITVARVEKEDMVEEETRATPFTTVEAVPPRSTPPIHTVVTMAVVPEVLLADMAVLDTERRTAVAVAVAVEEVIMVTERLTAVAAVLEGFTTLFKSFFRHVVNETNKSKTQK